MNFCKDNLGAERACLIIYATNNKILWQSHQVRDQSVSLTVPVGTGKQREAFVLQQPPLKPRDFLPRSPWGLISLDKETTFIILVKSGFAKKTGLPEHVFHSGLTRIGIALRDQGHGHSQARSLQQHVFCREASVSPVHAKGEGEVLTITQQLLAQELCWNADTMVRERENDTQRSTSARLLSSLTYQEQWST